MDKIVASLRHSLLQQLLLPAKSAEKLPGINPEAAKSGSQSSHTQLAMPPALRQLMASQQSPAQLIQLLQQMPNQHKLLDTLLSQLQLPANKLAQPQQLRQLVSDWFATNPVQQLTQPPVSSPANWTQSLSPALLLLLLERLQTNQQAPQVRQLLQNLFASTTASAAAPGAAPGGLMQQLFSQLQGNLNQIRLSQVQLADSSAAQQPDYYLLMPYESEQQQRQLELLLRKRYQKNEQEKDTEFWLFSMRLQPERLGPVLVKGRWDGEQVQLRFYTSGDSACRWLQKQLPALNERLKAQGLSQVDSEAHTGRVPETLAPQPAELMRVKA
ncbi:flagellar hook-length control protein FliK [Aliidiomarina minuta]|nr:flagellar hook-length control protein FliK [Aliidiomarina minuta]